MRTSKKRKIAGLRMKGITLLMKHDVYTKLEALAGQTSIVETVEKMTVWHYNRALKRNNNI